MNKETAKFGSVVILNPDAQKVCLHLDHTVLVALIVLFLDLFPAFYSFSLTTEFI